MTGFILVRILDPIDDVRSLFFLLVLVWVAMGLQHLMELQILLAPSVVASSIAATRIHRGLVDYASAGSTEQYDTTPCHSSLHSRRYRRLFEPSQNKANGRTKWKVNRVPILHTQLSRMEVAKPDMYEQHETPQMSLHGSFIDVEGQLYEKPARQPRLDGSPEQTGTNWRTF
jgi:hypothetical protein